LRLVVVEGVCPSQREHAGLIDATIRVQCDFVEKQSGEASPARERGKQMRTDGAI